MRDEANINQEELANAINDLGIPVSQGHWSRIERDKVTPSADLVAGAARVLSVRADYLLCLADDPYGSNEGGVGISHEAEEIASMVDELPTELRAACLEVTRAIVSVDADARSAERRRAETLLVFIRSIGGDSAYQKALAILQGNTD